METSIVSLEDRGKTAIVRFKERDSLFTTDSRAMISSWEALDKLQIQDKRVVFFKMPKGFLSPNLVDDFWEIAKEAPIDHAPRRGRALPKMVAVADASLNRTLAFLKSIPAYTISASEGEIDFDLLGLMLICNYRMCTADTVFVNHTLRRNVAPGSGTPWFLARAIGRARAEKLYMDEASLTAQEALELGIVHQISEPDSLEQDGLAVAQRFEEHDPTALQTMMKAMDLVDVDLPTYLEKAGTGFGSLPGSQ
jgi:enoyl-CoA hydratase/carnithine racemase